MKGHVFLCHCKNRVGVGFQVFECFKRKRINVKQMEAFPNGEFYLRSGSLTEQQRQGLLQLVRGIEGVEGVEEEEFMPSELKNKEMVRVINAIKEGLMVTNQDGIILNYNDAAGYLFNNETVPIRGQKIGELIELGPDFSLKKLNHNITHYKTQVHSSQLICYVDIYPVYSDHRLHRIIWVIRDVADVRRMVYNFSILPTMHTFGEIVYRSRVMQEIVDKARRVATTDASVLIAGESGTGKELLAKAIHMASPRRESPFVTVNCAALPENLLESELFGYEEGSFTGSRKGGKEGLFEFADQGTLFLDEIGELPLGLQAKLLRALQEQMVRRVGGLKEHPVDVRLITATNRNLEEAVKEGEFRPDLYYRINVIPLYLPPLRVREGDIPLLALHFVQTCCHKLKRPAAVLKDDFIRKLQEYPWPGNVRELQNVIERSLILSDTSVLGAENLVLEKTAIRSDLGDWGEAMAGNIEEIMEKNRSCKLKDLMDAVEREIMNYAFKRYRTSRKIGQVLGISNTAVSNKLRKYGITCQNRQICLM